MLIVGSTALQTWLPGLREPQDLDLFGPKKFGYEADVFWDERLRHWPSWEFRLMSPDQFLVYPDELYTIKVSHSYWALDNGSWDKHMFDIVALKRRGCSVIDSLHQLLYPIWEDEHGKKVVTLEMESMDFFSDAVVRRYDHDSLHRSVAYGDEPRYEALLKPGSTVSMDMGKLKALPFEEQILLFKEEIAAAALERWVIPKDYRFSPGRAWLMALKKTITSLTKGWSARFIVENYDQFAKPDPEYVQRHLKNKDRLIPLEAVR